MTADELRYDVFELLHEKHVAGNEGTPDLFVGLQGDKIIVMQPGGEHYVVLIEPAVVGAPV